jgi:hypothetical protein
MGVSAYSKIVRESCKVIWNILQVECLPKPTKEIWRQTATSYWKKGNIPNTIGSLDGKHIEIKYSTYSGSQYYNYKEYFLILLQPLLAADCKLIAVNIRAVGGRINAENLDRLNFIFY